MYVLYKHYYIEINICTGNIELPVYIEFIITYTCMSQQKWTLSYYFMLVLKLHLKLQKCEKYTFLRKDL